MDFSLHCWFFMFMASDPKHAITHVKGRALNLEKFSWIMSWPKGRVPSSGPAARRSNSKWLPKELHFYPAWIWAVVRCGHIAPMGSVFPGASLREAFAGFGQGFCQSGYSCHRDVDRTPLTHPVFLFAAAKSIFSARWIEWSWVEYSRFAVDALREAELDEGQLWGSNVFI